MKCVSLACTLKENLLWIRTFETIHLADIGYPNAAVDSMLDEVAQGDDLAGKRSA
jgi:hypothetical protein